MRSIITIVVGFVVAVLLAVLGCALVDGLHYHGNLDLCTIVWVVAILAWIIWSFGPALRAP